MAFEVINPLWEYQETLRTLDNENKARLAVAGWNLKRPAKAFHQIIPDRLEPRVRLRGSSFLAIDVKGGVSILGAISRFQDLDALKEAMESVENAGSPAFAFFKCQRLGSILSDRPPGASFREELERDRTRSSR